MKKNFLVLMALALTVFGMAVPLNMAFAKGPTGNARAGITQQVKARAGAKVGKFNKAARVVSQPAKKQQATAAQAADPCANDTSDDQEVKDSVDTDTDNVELQCGDQSGPDEQVEDSSGADTGAADTDTVQDETAGVDATEQTMPAQSK